MLKLSQFINMLSIGDPAKAVARMYNATINNTNGNHTFVAGNDIVMSATNAGTTAVGQFKAQKVWNAVWNDVADFQKLNDNLEYGKCYFDTIEGARICTQRCQMSVIGIASDTFGFAVGQNGNPKEVPIAVSGWVLAHVDQEYPSGTPLTNDEKGRLTEMTMQEKHNYPERMVGIYKKPEYDQFFGTETAKIAVNNRHWIKVK